MCVCAAPCKSVLLTAAEESAAPQAPEDTWPNHCQHSVIRKSFGVSTRRNCFQVRSLSLSSFRGGLKIMRFMARASIITIGVSSLIGAALAADMTGTEIRAFLSGKTVYVET